MEVRDLLTKYEFPGEKTPVVRGSAKAALAGDKAGEDSIQKLMEAIDDFIPFAAARGGQAVPDVH